MAASKEQLREWFEQGIAQGATHMVVVCDQFDYGDYPVFVHPMERARNVVAEHNKKSMQKVMEVYNLALPPDEQLDPDIWVFNW